MKQLLALFIARNKEYYRDRGSLAWSFVMPPIIIAVVALAFSNGEKPLFKVGLLDENLPPQLQQVLEPSYIQTVAFSEPEEAIQKVQYHQIDILIDSSSSIKYWVNKNSDRGAVMEQIIRTAPDISLQQQTVSGKEIRYIDWVIPGILGMNLMFSGLFGIGYVIVRYRKNGVLKRLQATPVSPFQFLTAQILSRLSIMLISSTLVYTVCNIFLDFLMLGNYLTLLLVAVIGNIAILSLGLTVASRLASEELANGLLNFLSFPMLMLSEVWFSLEGAPAWMSQASQFMPLTHMVQAARKVMIEGATVTEISHHLFALILMSIAFLLLSTRIFRWR